MPHAFRTKAGRQALAGNCPALSRAAARQRVARSAPPRRRRRADRADRSAGRRANAPGDGNEGPAIHPQRLSIVNLDRVAELLTTTAQQWSAPKRRTLVRAAEHLGVVLIEGMNTGR